MRLERNSQMSMRKIIRFTLVGLLTLAQSQSVARGEDKPASQINLDVAIKTKCLGILRSAFKGDEFWPSMHAAEALTLAGHGAEVIELLSPMLPKEEDDQRRCGLARELVRAGDRAKASVMLDILAGDDPHGHVHACESLYKVNEIGNGVSLREAMEDKENLRKQLMAAAALGRWGNPAAMKLIRRELVNDDEEITRISAWILGRIGVPDDILALRVAAERFPAGLSRAYVDHSLAALGDEAGVNALAANLQGDDVAIQVYAATFAGDARAASVAPLLLPLLAAENVDLRVRAAQTLLVLSQPPNTIGQETIVRQVYPATADNPRYSEGSIIPTRTGTLLYATTEFIGGGSDFARARIVARSSTDGGRNWTGHRVLQKNIGERNVMSATLCRLATPGRHDAPIGMFYLVKNSHSDLNVWLRVSRDDGNSFGEPILVTNQPGYHVMNNDRVAVLSSGRLLVPVASTSDVGKENHFVSRCFISDDQGTHWRMGKESVDYAKRGAMEPEVVELADGRLAMFMRTQLGHLAVSYSGDRGDTWSKAEDAGIRAPEAPATIRRIPSTGDLVLIWNDTFVAGSGHGGKRTPLSLAISQDDGKSWRKVADLETSKTQTFAYTSLCFVQARAVMSYYVRDEETGQISSRFRSLPISWFYIQKAESDVDR